MLHLFDVATFSFPTPGKKGQTNKWPALNMPLLPSTKGCFAFTKIDEMAYNSGEN
jgi:hypothetical protein